MNEPFRTCIDQIHLWVLLRTAEAVRAVNSDVSGCLRKQLSIQVIALVIRWNILVCSLEITELPVGTVGDLFT